MKTHLEQVQRAVEIKAGDVSLDGELEIPAQATGLVLFAHGSGSSRHSPRNQFVARTLREAGLGTLLFDLLTQEEEAEDQYTGALRFDIRLLASRLGAATNWVWKENDLAELTVGFFGSSTGGGAALVTAADLGKRVGAVVSRGGRPDLAGTALSHVQSPTLLIVGENDPVVLDLNEEAFNLLRCEKDLQVVPHATHLFEERGALERVAELAADWFRKYL
jgi:pimeloyl-ACP methyl ester carboxylesterase